ncbi:MAG TPA: YihY/virulence factor BrkB family protein [Acidobacteriaceae bacterium]|nr:YihY/virulence factor BrkB family protein [Acidobacteriaceae bacterium]
MIDTTPFSQGSHRKSGPAEAAASSVPNPGLEPDPPPSSRGSGLWAQLVSLARYLAQSEVHTYAFSVAANSILSLFPFIVMTWTIERRLFHSPRIESVLTDMLRYFLPAHQDFILRNMGLLANPRSKVQIISIVSLLISSTGVFLPLEVALNRVWKVKKNRSYLRNQLLSIGLAFCVGVLALFSIVFTAAQGHLLEIVFHGRTEGPVFTLLGSLVLRVSAAIFSISIFFLIYWILPNRKLPVRAVLPTAIVAGLLWEFAKYVYVLVLPLLNLNAAYGPFSVSVGLMIWAFITGLILLAGAQFSATRHTLRLAHQADVEERRKEAAAKSAGQ